MDFGSLTTIQNYNVNSSFASEFSPENQNLTMSNLNMTITFITTLENATINSSLGKPTWRKVLDGIQVILLSWGIVTNLLSALCFRKHPAGFSRQIQLIFEHQCWIDFCSCLIGFLTVVSPAYWSVGAYYFDYVMCYVWHGQILYWVVAANSYYGLVLIAMDRYLAVVKPILYKTITKRRILTALAVIYLLNVFFVWPLGLLVRMEGKRCTAG